MIDDLIAGKAQDLGEQREAGFKYIKAKMLEAFQGKLVNANPLVKASMIQAYMEGLDDMYRVFSQIVEEQDGEQIG